MLSKLIQWMVMITDSYAIDKHYLAEIKRIVPLLVSIDDLANISFPSDIVINQNIADNQYRNTKGVAEVSLLIDMSWGHKWREEKFYKATNELINNYLLRAKVSKVGQELVDGKGSPRCAQEILDLYSSEV